MLEGIQFTIHEILALVGVTQCVYILVYMAFRSGRLSRAVLPIAYFLVLGLAFLSDAAARQWAPLMPYYEYIQWGLWFSGPPLSVLLIIQIAQITRTPTLEYYLVLFLIPFSFIMAHVLSAQSGLCAYVSYNCPRTSEWLVTAGVLAGGVSLLTVWIARTELEDMQKHKAFHERFWLIMALVVTNVVFLLLMLTASQGWTGDQETQYARILVGLGLAYIASTSLFRIYPQAVVINAPRGILTAQEAEIAKAAEKLMVMDKVYQEPAYGRADMARELNVSETALSKIINVRYGKSFPQLLNEYRVEDAKNLLSETDLAVATIAREAGFNSIATFNRVFKETTGVSPSEFRENKKNQTGHSGNVSAQDVK